MRCGTQTVSDVSQVCTFCRASWIGSGCSNTRGFVTRRQNESTLGPWQTDGSGSVQLLIEPLGRDIMLSERAHMRIDKDIGIDQYHLKPSPSAMASASPILSTLAILTRPSATARVRIFSRGLRGLPMSSRPRRSASLIKRFRLIRRLRRNRSSKRKLLEDLMSTRQGAYPV